MMSNDDFGDLAFASRTKPDDGCDWTAVIIWEMQSKSRIRALINTLRPVPVQAIKIIGNAQRKTTKRKRANSSKKLTSMIGRNGSATNSIDRAQI